MPKTFSQQEREVIRQTMLRTGSALLRKKGLRQVTVEDITKGANIAKGSFYAFYNSREELFWEIIKTEEQQLLGKILDIAALDLDVKTKVKKIFHDAYLQKDSIVFYLPQEDIEYITRKLPAEVLQADVENGYDFNRKVLSSLRLGITQENVEFMLIMEKIMCFACSTDIPQSESTREKILDVLIDAFAGYFC